MTVKPTIIFIVMTILFVAVFVFAWLKDEGPFYNVPEEKEKAEVIEKRKVNIRDADNASGSTHYIVAFRFPDGSLKELRVGVDISSGREVYESFCEGDTGVLVYKERKDIEKFKNEDQRWEGRRFFSFEKDPEYGGTIIEKRGLPDAAGLIIGGVPVILFMVFLIVLVILDNKKN